MKVTPFTVITELASSLRTEGSTVVVVVIGSSALAAETPSVAIPADDGRSRAKIVSSDTRFDLNT
jgi:hypothetical protein